MSNSLKFSIDYNSPVVLTFCLISSAIFFIDLPFEGDLINSFFVLHGNFSLTSFTDYPTLFTYTLGHASIDHLLGNMSFLLLLGPTLEEKYGSQNLLVMMIITALITAILNTIIFSTGILGASGIVFMFIVLISFSNAREGRIPLTFVLILALFLGKEIYSSFEDNHVSEFGHIVGGICGSAFGLINLRSWKTEG